MLGPFTSAAMRETDSKSPSLVIGKPGLDHVHLQAGELVGYLDLLLHGEGDAGRLLAVAEGGVEDLYSTHVSLILSTIENEVEVRLLEVGGRGQRPARDRGG